MALSFDKVAKVITVLSDTEITIQNLLNGIREYEDELTTLDIPRIASCAGKEPLGGGITVGLTLTLLDDWQLAFEARSGSAYIQCKVSGGNIVAVNVNGAIYPTAFTQVLITASSSATQSELVAIQYASFGGGVTIDVLGSLTGTAYPVGTIESPVNNLVDAMSIANTRGFDALFVSNSMTLDSGTDIQDFTIIGKSMANTNIYIDPAAICNNISIENCNISGTLDGGTGINRCSVGDLNYINGHIHNSGLYGIIVLGGNSLSEIVDCWDSGEGWARSTINMGGSGQALNVARFTGGLNISNKYGTEEVVIDLTSGSVKLENTVTDGLFIIRGIGELVDESTGTTVNTDGLMSKQTITETSWDCVWVGTLGCGVSGTLFPIGTIHNPVDNMIDAKIIAVNNNIEKFHIHGNITLEESFEGYLFISDTNNICNINLNGQTITNSIFDLITLTGNGVGHFDAKNCDIPSGMTNCNYDLENCTIGGTFTVVAGEMLNLDRCTSTANTIFNLNGTGSVGTANFSGIVTFMNATDPGCLVVVTGYYIATLMDTLTAGQSLLSGIGILNDDSNGMTVTERTLPSTMWDESTTSHTISGSLGSTVSKIKKETGLIPALV